ncbi:MAG: T9SS type A sorting domain-containing protein, partial [Schleiferiaceae bacterium]|nr:T9SS type A sorting domain-containing protein [Schleiferiaceae bacterium]
LGNTGVGNVSFTPQHVARYYFIMNTANLGVEDNSIDGLKIFPNPTNGMLKIETNIGAAHFEYQISDAQGKIVDQGYVANTNGTSELELPKHCIPGTYLFTCEAGTTKFTLQ